MDLLRGGGNAVDAVVAMAAALNVVEPYMSGVGGAGFLRLHLAGGKTRVLNFSGNTPAAATPERFASETNAAGPRAATWPAGWRRCTSTERNRRPRPSSLRSA